jgi:drug/metabolite transporter (DMT)-like permease
LAAEKKNIKLGLFEAHTAVLLFGMAGLFGKWLALPALVIVAGRLLFASISLGSILSLTQKKALRWPPKNLLFSTIVLGVLLAFHWFSFFHAIQLTTVALGLITFATFPVFTAILEPLVFKERFEYRYLLFALGTAFGVYLAAKEGLNDELPLEGIIWGVLSGFSFAVLTMGNRKLLERCSALRLTFYEDLFAFICILPFLFFFDLTLDLQEWLLILLLGTVFTALAHYLFIRSLQSIEARTASIISGLEPVYGILFAIVLISEIPGLHTFLGCLIIISINVFLTLKR